METVSGLPPATGGHPLTWGLKVDRTNTPAITISRFLMTRDVLFGERPPSRAAVRGPVQGDVRPFLHRYLISPSLLDEVAFLFSHTYCCFCT
jgi:hypothetical protein